MDSTATFLLIGVDIGGTFTDFVVYDQDAQGLVRFKLLSTPHDPSEAVLEGLSRLPGYPSNMKQGRIVHGSTVATNAVLERKGAITALVTTAGFRDILNIGRQDRPDLYDPVPRIPDPLVPSQRCFEITERMDHEGRVVVPLQEEEVDALVTQFKDQRVESVAVSFLFSFINSSHEHWVATRLRQAGFFVTTSSEILPEFREYERTSTTVVNAFVSPVLDAYLGKLANATQPFDFHVLQSNGGRISVKQARGHGVRSILSGPAGGVVGAKYMAELAGFQELLTFDMGGTSTDVSLVKNGIQVTTETEIGGCPIRVPVIDIHTVGSGGGSQALVDAGGNLRVGPQSAGADPGPVCYGKGGYIPTVTDAHVLLGRLPPDGFLGGNMNLHLELTRTAFSKFLEGVSLVPLPGLGLPETLGWGMIDIANAHMERALRVISVERGEDPREMVLVSFGGGGGLHACDLARALGIPHVLISPLAATLSALGMLVADVQLDYVHTVMLEEYIPFEQLEEAFDDLVRRGKNDLEQEGIRSSSAVITRSMDMRYVGQSYELDVPLSRDFRRMFDECHQERYGYCQRDLPVEIVNVRVKAVGLVAPPEIPHQPMGNRDASLAYWENRPVWTKEGVRPVPHFRGNRLTPGHALEGPAVIVMDDTTVFLNSGDEATVDSYSNLIIRVGKGA